MKVRYAALPAIVALTAVLAVPAFAEDIDCSKPKADPLLCLKTAGWTETTGSEQADRITGTKGPDEIEGDGGNDRINSGGSGDDVNGGAGRDRIDLGTGNDIGQGGEGADTIIAGSGNDVIFARDGTRDTINCGTGQDTATVDAKDRVSGCEKVVRR